MKEKSPTYLFVILFVTFCCIANLFPNARATKSDENNSKKTDPADFVDTGRFTVRVFTDQNGLPQNTAETMTFDSKGYIWVGTQDGAAYYNGHSWKVVNMPDRSVSNFIKAMLASKDGGIWFGREIGGVSKLKDGVWTSFDDKSGLPSNHVKALLETVATDGTTTLWVGTQNGLARFQNGQWTVFNTSNGFPSNDVNAILETKASDGSSIIWVGTTKGLARFQNGKWGIVDAGTEIINGYINALYETKAEDGSSVLWIGASKGLAQLKDEKFTVIDEKDGITKKRIRCFTETKSPDGVRTLWVGTDGDGLLRYERGKWTVFSTKTGFPSNGIFSFLQSSTEQGTETLWIGTDGSGIAQMKQGQWITFDSKIGLPANSVFSLYEMVESDEESSLWIGTYGGGLARLKNAEWTIFDASKGLPDNTVFETSEITDEEGKRSLWIGTKGGGLVRLVNNRLIPFGKESGYTGGTIRKFLETTDADGSRVVWVSTGRGIAKYKNRKWSFITPTAGLPDKNVFEVAETTSQNGAKILWVATGGGGLARYENDSWTIYNKNSGLGNDFILCLHISTLKNGKQILWAGTQGGGVSRLDLSDTNVKWKIISDTTNPAIPNNTIYQIQEDAKGRIYLFTNKGVSRLAERVPTEDNPADYDVYTFTTEDGLPSNENNGGVSMVDSRGRIWAGTVAGAAVFDPAKEIENKRRKPLYIENILLDETEAKLEENASLAYNQSNITFEFALLSYSHEQGTLYQSQLVGLEDHPTPWSHENKRHFTKLPAGSYVFKVWGKDYAGNISSSGEIAFTIKPAFWRTWWAYLFYVLLLAGLVFLFISYRVRSLNQHNALLKEKVDERTKELAIKVEELEISERKANELAQAKSQFLANMSHEIRTPMNGVLGMTSLLLTTTLSHEQREYTELVKRSGDSLLTIIDDILDFSKIEAGKFRLESVAFDIVTVVEDVLELLAANANEKGVEVLSLIGQDVPQTIKGDSARVRQIFTNLLSNAIKFTERGEIVLSINLISETNQDVTIRCDIKDTGIGINKEELGKLFEPFTQADASTTRKYGGTGLGLAVSKQLVEMMNGEINVTSEQGEGSTFWFTAKFEKSDAPIQESFGIADLQGLKILSVIANETLAESFKRQLDSWNINNISTSDKKSAFDLLRNENSFDAVVVDSQIADWKNLVKEIQSVTSIPVIVMFPLGESFVKTGSVKFLAKPVRRDALARVLRSVIQGIDESDSPFDSDERDAKKIFISNGKKRILVVEDNYVNREVIIKFLEKMGFSTESVNNGKTAVERLRFERFDLVIMDCQMPDMDGFEATRQIRIEEGTTRRTPIIALTASALPHERAKCFEAGMDDFASKPIKQEEFEKTLYKWLNIYKSNGDNRPLLDSSDDYATVLDEKALKQLRYLQSEEDPNWLADLIEGFFAGTETRLAQLSEAIEKRDIKAIEDLAHTIRGACYQFGAFRMGNLSDILERNANDETDIAEQKELVEKIKREFVRVKRALEAFQTELKN